MPEVVHSPGGSPSRWCARAGSSADRPARPSAAASRSCGGRGTRRSTWWPASSRGSRPASAPGDLRRLLRLVERRPLPPMPATLLHRFLYGHGGCVAQVTNYSYARRAGAAAAYHRHGRAVRGQGHRLAQHHAPHQPDGDVRRRQPEERPGPPRAAPARRLRAVAAAGARGRRPVRQYQPGARWTPRVSSRPSGSRRAPTPMPR